jgi:thiol-disulfide isomerase/thioredoxin
LKTAVGGSATRIGVSLVLTGSLTIGLVGCRTHTVDDPAAATSLQLIDGRRITPGSIPERLTLVQFWATSCSICVAEQPQLQRLYQRYHPAGLELIAVAMPYDRPDEVMRFVSSRHVAYPVALDLLGMTASAFGGIAGTPTSFVLVRGQGVQQKIVGAIDFGRLEATITKLLQPVVTSQE